MKKNSLKVTESERYNNKENKASIEMFSQLFICNCAGSAESAVAGGASPRGHHEEVRQPESLQGRA
jgi:hypothetical protein